MTGEATLAVCVLGPHGLSDYIWIVLDSGASAMDAFPHKADMLKRYPNLPLGVTFRVTQTHFEAWQKFLQRVAS